LEDSDAEVEINSAWEAIGENREISAKQRPDHYKLRKHIPWLEEGCSE
jgi:hypothetical protein